MNLLAQLQAASRKPEAPKPAPKGAPHPRLKNLLKGGPSQTVAAIARYQKVMKYRGWMTQRQIENALGYATTVSTAFLHKIHKQGLIERRNKGGSPTYARRLGFEWRWVA